MKALKLGIWGCLAIVTLPSVAISQPYVGLRLQYSSQVANSLGPRVGPVYEVDDRLTTLGVYAGYAFEHWFLELGGGPLSRRVSHNVSSTYNITQTIETKHVYGNVMYRWILRQFSPYVLAGVSWVSMKNYEYGFNEGGPAVNENYSRTVSPMLGGGVAHSLGKWELRADVFRINNVAESIHTNSSDVTAVSLGIHYRF
jgi:Outer membrane protein beta-barrel domain